METKLTEQDRSELYNIVKCLNNATETILFNLLKVPQTQDCDDESLNDFLQDWITASRLPKTPHKKTGPALSSLAKPRGDATPTSEEVEFTKLIELMEQMKSQQMKSEQMKSEQMKSQQQISKPGDIIQMERTNKYPTIGQAVMEVTLKQAETPNMPSNESLTSSEQMQSVTINAYGGAITNKVDLCVIM